MSAEDRLTVERSIIEMMREAFKASHRRLLVVCGEEALNVMAYVVLKHQTLRGENSERVVFVSHGGNDGMAIYNGLIEKLREMGCPATHLKHCTYEGTHKIMGTTNDLLILDMSEGARPNDIGRLVETVRGGGLVILYNLDLRAEKPWSTSIHKKLASPPYTEDDLRNRFEKFFVRKILEHPCTWILENWKIVKGELLNPPKTVREKPMPPKRSRIPQTIFKFTLTREQMEALEAFEFLDIKKKGLIILISNRGRGKSALLGLGAASLLSLGFKRVIVTAPACEEVQTVFEMAERALLSMGERTKCERANDLIYKLTCKKSILEFVPPYRTIGEVADAVLVDEAGGIHVSLLFRVAEKFPKTVFASTVHGYEGAGRGFSIRFLKSIEKLEDVKPYMIELREPIRYAPEDPVEKWLYDALLLNAEPAELEGEQINLEECKYEKPNLDFWFEKDEERLRQFIGIYALAHYRNRPDDLLILGDAPHHSARALLSGSGKVLAALHVNEEGRMSDELLEQVLKGKPPSGHLIPSCIVKYNPQHVAFSKLRGLRVVRVAVHPELMRRGLGSLALKRLCEEAEREGFDWVGASFGANAELIDFWLKNGFVPVHISPMRNVASGEFSIIVVKPLNINVQNIVKEIHREFKLRLLDALPDTYFNLDPQVAARLLKGQNWASREPFQLSKSQLGRLLQYSEGNLAYEGACDAVKHLLKVHFMSSGEARLNLEVDVEAKLVARCLQARSWGHVTRAFKTTSANLKAEVRSYIAKMIAFYNI
ncbi:tRNA(Met) cytidine acetyltransferase [Candidatus Bathyarchaeota archaeon]|nr:tRNA(Met) cytidine acetyltransferase [Candidatus Bathyarchaeota archaeon]